MQIDCGICADREEWNTFVAREPSFALLQSWGWGEFKEKLGWKPFRIAVRQGGTIVAGAQMLIKSFIPGLLGVAYIPRGPIGNWLDAGMADGLLSALHQIARRHHAAFLKIEPPLPNEAAFHRLLEQHGFRASTQTNQPRATIILDLDQPLEELLAQMRKKTRQYIKKAATEGITVRVGSSGDLPTLYGIMRSTSQREGFPHHSLDYYKQEWQPFADNGQAVLLMAVHQDRVQAVRTAYCFGQHAAEFHGGSLDSAANLHVNYLLAWEAIKWAKTQGCCTYDLWGIPDEIADIPADRYSVPPLGGRYSVPPLGGRRSTSVPPLRGGNDPPASVGTPYPLFGDRTDGLWGVYRFKSGFGDHLVSYVGAYDYVYSAALYALISTKLFSVDTLQRVEARVSGLHEKGSTG